MKRRWLLAGLALATVAAALLRFPFLGAPSLWFDEIFTRTIVGRHSLAGIWDQIERTESTPPLYYLLAKLCSDVSGARNAVTLRFPAAVALAAAVPVSFVAFRGFVGERAALGAAVIVAVDPMLVEYSTDARSYALLVLCALLSVWGFGAVLRSGSSRAFLGWALASIACIWSHYFGVFTVAGEALILLACRPALRRRTLAWSALIALCVAPLVPLAIHQNDTEDAAFIAGISLLTRIEQTVRQFGMGANVPRAWLEGAGLLVLYLGAAVGALQLAASSEPGGRILLALALITLGAPLLIALTGIEDRFYVRNLIAAVPMLAAVAAYALTRLRAAPLAAYCALAVLSSIWVSTNWRYQEVDWRAAIHAAQQIDPRAAVITDASDDNVAATYLRRGGTSGPVTLRHALLIVEPYRGPHDRALVPSPIPRSLAGALRPFQLRSLRTVDAFRILSLTARAPTTLSLAAVPHALVFPPSVTAQGPSAAR